MFQDIASMTENSVAKTTGCLPKCNRREFTVQSDQNVQSWNNFFDTVISNS